MGCSSSNPSAQAVPTLLTNPDTTVGKRSKTLCRSLSITDLKPEQRSGTSIKLSEEDEQLVAGNDALRLTQHLLSDRTANEPRFNIGSCTDPDLNGRKSFDQKTVKRYGDQAMPEPIGYSCCKGLKPESPNQDSFVIIRLSNRYSLYAVFDGHGRRGHDVSQFVKERLPELIVRDPRFAQSGNALKELLKEAFIKIQLMISYASEKGIIDAKTSGTTTTLVIHDRTLRKLWVAHVADSAACIIRRHNDGEASALPLTHDHRPDDPREKTRIEQAGGQVVVVDDVARVVAQGKRYPGVNMSRCHGDLLGHEEAGLSCEPEILEHDVTSDDEVLLICSDGIWEFTSFEDVVSEAASFGRQDVMDCAARLSKLAWDRWIKAGRDLLDEDDDSDDEVEECVDDITCLCIHLQPAKVEDTSI